MGALGAVALAVFVSAVLGGVVGFICRGHVWREIVTSAVVTTALFLCIQLRAGSISFHWPVADIINGAIYLIIPFIVLFLLPAVMMSVAVGQWGRRNQ